MNKRSKHPWRWYLIVIILMSIVLCRALYQVKTFSGAANLEIFLLGSVAAASSCILAVFLWKVDHDLGRSMAMECIADIFSASCTTVFSALTLYEMGVDPFLQSTLRVLIVGSSIMANVHVYWAFYQAEQRRKDEFKRGEM